MECLFDDCISEVRWGLDGYTIVCTSSTAHILVIVLDKECYPPTVSSCESQCFCLNTPDDLASFLKTATPEYVNSMSGGFGFGLPQVRHNAITNEQIQTMQQTTVVGGRKRIMPVMETSQGDLRGFEGISSINQLKSPNSLPSMSTNTMAGNNQVLPAMTMRPQMSSSTGMLRPDLAMMSGSNFMSGSPMTMQRINQPERSSNVLEDSIEIVSDQPTEIILAESTQQTIAKIGYSEADSKHYLQVD